MGVHTQSIKNVFAHYILCRYELARIAIYLTTRNNFLIGCFMIFEKKN